jgi:3-hydroxybutyryl-CoA dehydrogenase
MKTITVIGSGTMGNGIAHTFAQYGYKVNLVDVNNTALQNGMDTIKKNIDRQLAKGLIDEEQKTNTLNNIKTCTILTWL